MASGQRKTQASEADVGTFLASVTDDRRRQDAAESVALMKQLTGEQPVMWGTSMIGFGRSTYTTADGKQHDWFVVGLSPRKANLTLYGLLDAGVDQELLGRLGPHTLGKGCVYVKRLGDVDRDVLIRLIERAWTGRDAGESR